ncbi:MAG: hypothetical protein ACREJO_12015 [Phycisphaerales bacterium]
MPTQRTRIVPRFAPSGTLGIAVLAGSLGGIVSSLGLEWQMQNTGGLWAFLLVNFGLMLFPIFAFAPLVTFTTQRPSRVALLCGTFLAAQYFAGSLLYSLQTASKGLGWTLDSMLMKLLLESAVAAAFGAVFGLFILFTVRQLFFTTLEQDGQFCWRCSYPLASGRITTCPECGTPMDAGRFRWNWLHRSIARLRRIAWPAVAVLFLGWIAITAAIWPTHIAPVRRFSAAMQQHATVGYIAFMLPANSNSRTLPGSPCTAATLPLDASNSLDLLIAYAPKPESSCPVMQLQVSKATGAFGSGPDAVTEHSMGSLRVLCDLDDKQAAYIMANGVPDSLKAAMLKASATTGWNGTPSLPPFPPDTRIDPAPHFPPH